MKTLFLEAPYEDEEGRHGGKLGLSKEVLAYLKSQKYQNIALFSSVQFLACLNPVKKQLLGININAAAIKLDRASAEGQLLGCNVYSLPEVDCYLYIGDGKFHPLALIYGQKDNKELKEVVCYDPLCKKMALLTIDDVSKVLKKYRGSMLKFLDSKNIGVLISLKPGQEQLKAALKLENVFKGKKFYYFVDNAISFGQLENFPFIGVWVNAACPRIALDEQEMFARGIVNLNDALNAKEILSRDSVLNRLGS